MANARARWLRANQTDAERHLWKRLRELKADGAHFRRQAPIGRFVTDFACHSRRLVIELDGGQHADAEAVANDRNRTRWLNEQGYRVLRFWNNEVLGNTDGVMMVVCEALGIVPGHPTPAPAPSRGGENGEES